MKSITNGWRIGIVLLFGVTPLGLAVNGDLQAPGWRGQPGTTRQHWRFDTDASPTAPEVVSNAAGSPQATIAPNALAAGWYDSYVDVYGTAQGFWDLGGTNLLAPSPGTVLLTIPNTVSAGATRYLWVQATVWIESSLFDYSAYVISNAVQIGSTVNVEAEAGPVGGAWYNQQTLWSVSATTTSNNLVLSAAGGGTIIDAVAVDTLLLAANPDIYSRGPGVPLEIKVADLLTNDLGDSITFAGLTLTSTNGVTVTTNATTIFYTNAHNVDDRLTYSIQDSYGGVASAYVLIQVSGETNSSLVVVRLQTGVPGPNTNTVTLAGIPNYQYVVQFATNVAGSPWFNFSTNTAGTNGLWTVLDSTATNVQRYYRVTTP